MWDGGPPFTPVGRELEPKALGSLVRLTALSSPCGLGSFGGVKAMNNNFLKKEGAPWEAPS